MAQDDETDDIVTAYAQPLELSGVGELDRGGEPHIHVTVSGEGDVARHGHLHEAVVGGFFVRVYAHR